MANSKIVNTPSQAIAQAGTTHTQRTIGNTAVNIINFTLNANTTHVFIQFTGGNARVTLDGTTLPTTSLGFQYPDGSTAYWPRDLALSAKAIQDDAATVICEIQQLNFL